jgi:phage protein D
MTATAAAQHVSPFSIKVAGQDLDNTLNTGITEIKIRQALHAPSSASIRISDPRAEHMDSHPLQIGKDLEISMGAPEANQPVKVFVGEIVALEPEFDRAGVTIGVRAYDKLHRLNRQKKVRTFQEMSASDMVAKVMREAGIDGSADSTSTVFPFFQQSDETDREFIRRLELMHDCELVMVEGRYKFRPCGHAEGSPTQLKYGDSLLAFRPRVTAAQQDTEVEVRGWDVKLKQAAVGNASAPQPEASIGIPRNSVAQEFGGGKLLVSDRSPINQGEATAIAKATFARLRSSRRRGPRSATRRSRPAARSS